MDIISRRNFLKGSAVLGGLAMLPSCVSKPKSGADLNGKLNVAVVGVGGQGSAAVKAFGTENSGRINLIAFCDVDDNRAAENYKKYPNVARFKDYREMLDKMDSQIDAVAVCTPDHMHYPIAMWAIAKGKHVYLEKPLCRTIWECREIQKAAKEAGVLTQMGNQGHTFDGWRTIKEWYDAGILGEIKEVYQWTSRPFWPQGNLPVPEGQPVPKTLDYHLWLGVAPYQPYNKIMLPFNWRGMKNFGTGNIGDMGCHYMDVPYSAFDLGYPSLVSSAASADNDMYWPHDASIVYDFPAKGKRAPVKLYWYDGGRKPKHIDGVDQAWLDNPQNKECTVIVGTKNIATCGTYGDKPMIIPREKMVELKKSNALPAPTMQRYTEGPHLNWAYSILDGKQPVSNFDYAAPFAQVALLGMASIAARSPLVFDPVQFRFTNNPSADKYLSSLYEYNKEFLPYAKNANA